MANTIANDLNISQAGYVFFDGASVFTGRTFATQNTTVQYTLSGSTQLLNFGLANLFLGSNPSGITGNTNVSVGALNGLALTSGIQNSFFGVGVGQSITTGNNNTLIGYASGSGYAVGSESGNILINAAGVSGESTVTRIGTSQVKCFLSGVSGATPTSGNIPQVVVCDNLGQLTPLSSSSSGFVLTSNGTGTPSFQPISPLSEPSSAVYGDGSDGSVTFDGSTVVLGITPSASTYTLARDILLGSSVINTGISIITNGFRIFCNGTLTNNGTINSNGNSGTNTGVAGAVLSNGNSSINSNGGNGALGTAGGAGNTGAGSQGTVAGGSQFGYGGVGQAGGAGLSAGGIATTQTVPIPKCSPFRSYPYCISCSIVTGNSLASVQGGTGGGGGGGDSVVKGGGGGGGAGVVVIASYFFSGTGNIQAIGGAGGNGGDGGVNCGGGGGGGGGVVSVISKSVSSGVISGQTINISGGTGGSPTGIGSSGTNGLNGLSIILYM